MNCRTCRRAVAYVLLVVAAGPISNLTATAAPQSPEADAYQAVTASDPAIEIDRLKVLIRPLTRAELSVEAAEWLDLLRAKIGELGATEMEISAAAEEENADDITVGDLTEQMIEHRRQEADLVKRSRIVVEALEAKGGDVEEYQLFLSAVTDLSDTTDATSYRTAVVAKLKNWLASEDGGQLLLRRSAMSLAILFVFWLMSKFAGSVISRLLAKQAAVSNLLGDFARRTTGGLVMIVGILMAVSVLGFQVGPMMAALGAGGFIVGFALQETLGSFASGLMIMIYRPFDVADYVSIAGDEGTVKEMSLVSTTLLTADNKVVVVPNKKAWSDTIINYTGERLRRVDLVFGISYDDDMRRAMDVLREVAAQHSLTLDQPELNVRVGELADSSVNLLCRPWVKTGDYWSVYWELTQQVKERFDAEGISFPFPQHDVHMATPPVAAGE